MGCFLPCLFQEFISFQDKQNCSLEAVSHESRDEERMDSESFGKDSCTLNSDAPTHLAWILLLPCTGPAAGSALCVVLSTFPAIFRAAL